MIAKNCLDILMEQVFLHFFSTPYSAGFPEMFDLYLKGNELFVVTSSGFPALLIGDSSPLSRHKLSDVSE